MDNKKLIDYLQIDGFFPDNRMFVTAQLVDDQIFIHGGYNNKKEYNQIDIYDLSTHQWKVITDISTVNPFFIFDKSLSGHSSNLIKQEGSEKIVLYGGFDGNCYSNAIYLIETDNYSFTQIDVRSSKDYPMPRNYHTSVYKDDSLYIFGGWNGNINNNSNSNFSALWRFDLKCIIKFNLVLFWEKIILNTNGNNQSTTCLRGHSCISYKNHLIVYGGISGFNKYSSKLYQINLKVK
jgi:hypothetical protein